MNTMRSPSVSHAAVATAVVNSELPKRYPLLDALRTVAIVGMVLYHLAYDLAIFYSWRIDIFHGGWLLLERGTAILFLLLVGVSFAVSLKRFCSADNRPTLTLSSIKKYGRRGVFIFACGLLVTLVTAIIDPETYVRFGILHLIGIATMLLPFIAPLGLWSIAIAISALLSGWLLRGTTVSTSLLIPLGLPPSHFATVDYFPLLPWFGVIVIGYAIGYVFFWVQNISPSQKSLSPWLTWPGRHSLLLYLVHQPLIIAVLWLIYR